MTLARQRGRTPAQEHVIRLRRAVVLDEILRRVVDGDVGADAEAIRTGNRQLADVADGQRVDLRKITRMIEEAGRVNAEAEDFLQHRFAAAIDRVRRG